MSFNEPVKYLKGRFEKILVIGDLHAPYNHMDALPFLRHIRDHFGFENDNPKHLICSIGDEVDGHGWSYHDKDPELQSPGAEYRAARTTLKHLSAIFPKMKILESNHGSLHLRKQKSFGLPKGFFRDYNEAWDVPKTWEWLFELTVEMSNGNHLYLHHSKSNNVLKVSQTMGMCVAQGHHHELMGARYWASPTGVYWAAQTGCLVNQDSLAMAYGKNNLKRPVLGSLVVINGYPIPVPFVTDEHGRWIGRLT